MIIVRLKGGLGNQMFQYALGRHLAIKNRSELALDISQFQPQTIISNATRRNYDLSNFQIVGNIATWKEVQKARFLSKIVPFSWKRISEKSDLTFDKKALDAKGDNYIDGYWQSEKYFSAIKETLYEDFKLKQELVGRAKILQDQILNSNSVSLHVRRGDYVSNYSNLYHILSLTFYEDALGYLSQIHTDLKIFIFSDDIKWVKDNIKGGYNYCFIDPNKSYEDLYLMSICKHNIIANSSFSWWGAWLNSNSNKCVIYSKDWYRNPEKSTVDLIPKEWKQI